MLIADDDLYSRETMVDCLQRGGYDIQTAESSDEALRLLTEKAFDLYVIDYHIPGAPVDEVIARVRKLDSDIVCIIVTGDISPEAENRARKLSPAFFFVKPFDMFDFRAVVDNAISKGRKHERSDY